MIHVTGWLRRGGRWLHPSRCEDCGARRAVVWTASTDDGQPREQWGSTCVVCRLDRYTEGTSTHTVFVYEVCQAGLRPAGERRDPAVHVWMRPGCTVPPTRLADVLGSFANLEHARAAATRIPDVRWAVEIRDGQPWAPWNPRTGVYKRGAALPLRQTKLRRSKGERACEQCKVPLTAGSTAWVPVEIPHEPGPGGAVWRKGGHLVRSWDHGAISRVKVCSACVSAARVREADEPGEMVQHLRVLEGGA